MTARRIQRSMLVAGVLVVALAFVPGVARASGGGGCGSPVTDGTGATVEIESFCFTPTIVRTEPGTVVTFANRDRTTHNILGANGSWGSYDALKRGREVSYRFEEAGVFPYVCVYHVGMVGVVVVGDGIGGAIDTTTADGPVTKVSAEGLQAKNAAAVLEVPSGAVGNGPAIGLLGELAMLGAAALVLGVVVVRRRRRRSLA